MTSTASNFFQPWRCWLLSASLMLAAGLGHAGVTDIASSPLTSGSAVTVQPNLMFVLDDSGSMNWDFMPDYVTNGSANFCRSAGATSTGAGAFGNQCCQNQGNNEACWLGAAPFGTKRGHPPFLSNSFNSIYYDPNIRYLPRLNENNVESKSQTSAETFGWSVVKNDHYGIQNTTSINLLTQFPDTEWCTDSAYTDCLRNGNYVLPGTVDGKNYTTFHETVAVTPAGGGKIAVGQPNVATVEAREFGPHYYRIVAAEYCDSEDLRNCQFTPTSVYKFPAPVRWCSTTANATANVPAAGSCQAIRTANYPQARYPTKIFAPGTAAVAAVAAIPAIPAVPAKPASATVTVTTSGCSSSRRAAVDKFVVNGVDLFSGNPTALENNQNTLANRIRDRINAATATNGGYSASVASSNRVTIVAPVAAGNINYGITLNRTTTSNALCLTPFIPTAAAFGGYVAAIPEVPGVPGTPAIPAGPVTFPGAFVRVDIVPSVTSYPKGADRDDCAGATCTYAEEMTNFANWWTYSHTRMQMMKTGASRAFSTVSDRYRLGYISLNNNTGSDFLNPGTFSAQNKADWFAKLVAAEPSSSTPLRGALSTVGRLYAGKLNGTTLNGSTVKDPMQYSCQKNFTILSTDGYWNGTNGTLLDGSTDIGNQDGTLARPMLDGLNTPNTLADVAAYYYATDLRTDNCTSGGGNDLCENNVPIAGDDNATHQHMTTFTLGLGISGFMRFQEDYATALSGDFFSVKEGSSANPAGGVCSWQASGACNWPAPASDSQANIDDLWHAALNGRGSYFNAGNPDKLTKGLTSALAKIESETGAAAAATTSNPNVASGDNFVFISNYTAPEWSGELLGLEINVETGAVEDGAAPWSAAALLDAKTSRTIYTFSGTGRRDLTWAALPAAEQAFFEKAHITATGRSLSQFCTGGPGSGCLDATEQDAASGERLLDFVRGSRVDEGTFEEEDKFFRKRGRVLGDIVNSEAVYVKGAPFNYVDSGYAAHKATIEDASTGRKGVVYVGANDGMLHAFDATSGEELWAYVPRVLLPELYRLADKKYETKHRSYVDSTPTVAEVYSPALGAWRTLLVGGLGAGGRSYYALDITDPDNPLMLWEFSNANLGLTFGKPEIAKLKTGKWVVMVASGYNNVAPGTGAGRLFVLDADSGVALNDIVTSAGTPTTPSGLAHIRAWVDNTDADNTVQRVYGGDNEGNLWRFDVNGDIGAAGIEAHKVAELTGPNGVTRQPVTARPELGLVSGNAIVYAGTGRYLGETDLGNTERQSIYAVKDTLGTTTLTDIRNDPLFKENTLTTGTCPAGATACTPGDVNVRVPNSSQTVDLRTDNGWLVDLPATSERATTDPQLALGTLTVTTNVLGSSLCSDGSSYINFFDYRTGAPVSTASGVVSVLLSNDALAARAVVIRLPNGKVVSISRLSNNRTVVTQVPVGSNSGATRRISWRELATEQ